MKPLVTKTWNPGVRRELEALFDSALITDPLRFESSAARARLNRPKYEALLKTLPGSIPWWFVACLHSLESNYSFDRHLHNGDPLSARTVNEPSGRPPGGIPPFSWYESARDALTMPGKRYHLETDWSIAHVLWLMEAWNGLGYRLYHGMNTPFLWAGTSHYTKGKYRADREFDPSLVSKQAGVAGLLKMLLSPGELNQGGRQ